MTTKTKEEPAVRPVRTVLNESELTAKDAIAEHRQRGREYEERAQRAAVLETQLGGLREDVARLERRRDKFAALGKGHVEKPMSTFEQGWGVVIEWEPIRSALTGAELAAKVEATIVPLREQVASLETQIRELLAVGPAGAPA